MYVKLMNECQTNAGISKNFTYIKGMLNSILIKVAGPRNKNPIVLQRFPSMVKAIGYFTLSHAYEIKY